MRYSFLFSAFFFSICVLDGQETLVDMKFLPPAFYIGDPVELQLEYSLEAPVKLAVPKILPKVEWVDIRDIRIVPSDDMVRISIEFTSFAAGNKTLPTIDLGAIVLQDIRISTLSLLGESHDGVRRLRGQLLLPGTRIGVTIVLTLIAMSPFLLHSLYRLLSRLITSLKKMFHVHRPARRFRRLLRKLNEKLGIDSASDWYLQLSRGIRNYLSERTGCDCRSATTSEISAIIGSSVGQDIKDKLLQVLKVGDMVKFAGQNADMSSLKQTLAVVESVISEWEKTLARF